MPKNENQKVLHTKWAAHFSPHYGFLCIKNIPAAQVHGRAEVLTLGEGVIKYYSVTHTMTETGGLGPDLTHKHFV